MNIGDHAKVPGSQFRPGVKGLRPRPSSPIPCAAPVSTGCRDYSDRKANLEGPGWTVRTRLELVEGGGGGVVNGLLTGWVLLCRSSLGGTSSSS